MGPIGRIAAAGLVTLMLAPALATSAAAAQGSQPTVTPISMTEARSRPVLRPRDRGVWVRRLNRALGVTPLRTFGQATSRAVMAFRTDHGQRPRPVVNARTWVALGSRVEVPLSAPTPTVPRPELSLGDSSSWVQAVQAALGVEADGHFGPITLAAVKGFQRTAGLPVTGVVDAATWAALGTRVTEPVVDVTTTDLARSSRAHRAAIGVTAFASSWTARMVVQRESGGQCDISNPSGTYRGKWQMDASFWSTYGGKEFAARADLASCAEQDVVAYRGWVDRWWQPWPTAIP